MLRERQRRFQNVEPERRVHLHKSVFAIDEEEPAKYIDCHCYSGYMGEDILQSTLFNALWEGRDRLEGTPGRSP